jgi:ELWxxDGT repeat protein
MPRTSRATAEAGCLEQRLLISASLLKDVNTQEVGSAPTRYIPFRDDLYFAANGPAGREVHRTNGTPEGTALVADVRPGPADGLRPDFYTAVVGDTLYFSADGGDGAGFELWKTDGTPGGTTRVTDINPGAAHAEPRLTTAFAGGVYFAATDTEHGEALWKSDGTAAGTQFVFDTTPQSASGILEVRAAGGMLYFTRNLGGGLPMRLFVTDGTTDGTYEMPDVMSATRLTPFGDRLAFVASSDSNPTHGVWVTNGTPAGTYRIGTGTGTESFTVVGDTLYYLTFNQGSTTGLWKSDGTPEGTFLVRSFSPQVITGGVEPSITATAGGILFFPADDGSGWRLWRSDGTPDGTFPLAAVRTVHPVAAGDTVYFSGYNGQHALWRSDGTAGGTVPVIAQSSAPHQITPFRGGIVFTGYGPNEPWFSDGTAAGTYVLEVNPATYRSWHVEPELSTRVLSPVSLGDRVLFLGTENYPGNFEMSLWGTDGTPQGTARLPGPANVRAIARLGDAVYALGNESVRGGTLWRTRGTPETTTRVTDLVFDTTTPSNLRWVDSFTEWNGALYFAGNSLAQQSWGHELTRTDGTPQGTYMVKNIRAGGGHASVRDITAAGDRFFFTAEGHPTTGNQLWVSRGGETDTLLVRNFYASAGGSMLARNLVGIGNRLFFRATGPGGSSEIWTSNGTPDGTVMLNRFAPQPPSRTPPSDHSIVNVGGVAYFTAAEESNPSDVELWKSDGTKEGTVRVKDIQPGDAGSLPRSLVSAGDRLFFSATGPDGGRELWASDGTEAGTVRVRDFNPGAADGNPVPWTAIAGRLYVSADDGVHGSELWSINLAGGGATLVADAWAGPPGSLPQRPTPAGDRIVFWPDDGVHGREPWAATHTVPATVLAARVFYNHSAFDGGDAAANAADDGAIAHEKVALSPGQERVPGFDNVTSYTRGINGVMIDIENLPVVDALLGANDFDFGGAPPPVSVTVRRAAGVGGSDRVTLIWRDYNPRDSSPLPQAVANGWLTVTVKANDRTGLAEPHTFSLGNLAGETGDPFSRLRVGAIDLRQTRARLFSSAPITSRFDFNRDGKITAVDYAIARSQFGRSLGTLTGPVGIAPVLLHAEQEKAAATVGASVLNG